MTPDSSREVLLQEIAALREINTRQQEQIEAQHYQIGEQPDQIEALIRRIDQITQDNVVLRLKIDAMARKLFGRSQ